MSARFSKLRRIVAAGFVISAVSACGEEGQTIGAGQCNATNSLPLYTWVYDASTKEWAREGPGGKPLSPTDLNDIQQAEQGPSGGSGRCITPRGTSLSVGAGGGGSKDAGTKG